MGDFVFNRGSLARGLKGTQEPREPQAPWRKPLPTMKGVECKGRVADCPRASFGSSLFWVQGSGTMRFVAMVALGGLSAFALAGCSSIPGDPGFANHPLDCALGFRHSDCQPGTAGYNGGVALNDADDTTCRSYGLQFGTPAYAQCRQNIEAQRGANARAAAALIASQAANRPPPPPPPQPSPTFNTSCQHYGTTTN